MEEHIEGVGLDLGKEEDMNTLCGLVVRAHRKGDRAFGELMKEGGFENWERLGCDGNED